MMLKFLLVSLLAICVIQTSEARHFSEHQTRGLNEIIQAVKDIVEKVKNTIADLQGKLQQAISDLQEKLKNIIAQIDIPALVNQIQEKINEILENAGIDASKAKECLEAEKAALDNLAKTVGESVNTCVANVDNVLRTIKDNALDIEEKSKELINSVNAKIASCLKNPPIEAVKCIQGQVEPVKQEVEELIQAVTSTVASSQEAIMKATEDLTACASDIQNTISSEKDVIINDFKKCVSTTNPSLRIFQKSTFEEIYQVLNALAKKMEEMIKEITEKIPTMLEELDNKIKEVLANVDLEKFMQDVKAKIEDILKKSGIDASAVEDCIQAEEHAIKELVSTTHEATVACVTKVDDLTRDLKDKAMALQDKTSALTQRIVEDGKICFKDIDHALPCIKDLAALATQEMVDLNKEIIDFVKTAQAAMSQAAFDFTSCMVSVQFDLYANEQGILSDFKECVVKF